MRFLYWLATFEVPVVLYFIRSFCISTFALMGVGTVRDFVKGYFILLNRWYILVVWLSFVIFYASIYIVYGIDLDYNRDLEIFFAFVYCVYLGFLWSFLYAAICVSYGKTIKFRYILRVWGVSHLVAANLYLFKWFVSGHF